MRSYPRSQYVVMLTLERFKRQSGRGKLFFNQSIGIVESIVIDEHNTFHLKYISVKMYF